MGGGEPAGIAAGLACGDVLQREGFIRFRKDCARVTSGCNSSGAAVVEGGGTVRVAGNNAARNSATVCGRSSGFNCKPHMIASERAAGSSERSWRGAASECLSRRREGGGFSPVRSL